MTATSTEYPASTFRYLSRADVVQAIESVDVLAVVADGLRAHATGRTVLPAEAYLGWRTQEGFAARCLAMPGALSTVDTSWYGLKVINGSLGNPARGIARSQGFTMLFDPETARPVVVMEAAYISALRTAAVTALAARRLGVAKQRALAMIGCGTLARVHANLLLDTVPTLREVALFDTEPARAERLAAALAGGAASPDVRIARDAEDCVRGADLVVPVTTTTEGYLAHHWLKPGALIVNVSLDDVLPEVVHRADLLVVDDWELVRADEHRLLGRMYRAGELLGPDSGEDATTPGVRRVDATLGEVLAGSARGRLADTDIVLCNPFGMAILDVTVAGRVFELASRDDIGHLLPV